MNMGVDRPRKYHAVAEVEVPPLGGDAVEAAVRHGVVQALALGHLRHAEHAAGQVLGVQRRVRGGRHLVEAAAHVAPTEDEDIAKELDRSLSKGGKTCIVGVKAVSLLTKDGQAELSLEDGRVITAAKALVAVGRTPNTAGLDCEKAGCTLKRRGFVEVNECLEAAEGVYAIGDVNGLTLLAHAAEHQGVYVARRVLGQEPGVYVPGPVPSCIYGSIEVMRVGQTAKALVAAGRNVSVSQVPLTLNAIAQAGGCSGGFVKVVWEDDAIAGIAAIGHGVSHLVTVAQMLIVGGYDADRLHEIMFAHPTLDEIVPAAIRAPRVAVSA